MVSRSTCSRSAPNPSTRNCPGDGSAVHCTSTSSRSDGSVRSSSRDTSANPDEASNPDDTCHARHSGAAPGASRYTPLTRSGSTFVTFTTETVPPTDTPSRRAAVSDSTTWSGPDGQLPCTNCANRCGSATEIGTTGNPAPAGLPVDTAPPGNGTVNGLEARNTSSTWADVPGNARRNAPRTWASAFSSAPSAYRPTRETDTRGSSANRLRIPSVTELAVNAVNAVSTATANHTVTAAAPSTTPCCPARRTPAGEPRPSTPMSPEALPSPSDGLDQS
ncbi:hypothetical protein Kpho02_18730 [Kitasatospora phosalacinea]|uniref:Uncharacterized protein n=1 Tax=Kitasatospora phosalacinea TaxID=2065 RepID=A0A9W6UZF1_9ACTN|nr:hypothetical protein Kpho02_18730 [Kitasatospora phosalacinea]